jgi:hypothetical protein
LLFLHFRWHACKETIVPPAPRTVIEDSFRSVDPQIAADDQSALSSES